MATEGFTLVKTLELIAQAGGIVAGIFLLWKYFKNILIFIKDLFLIPFRVKVMMLELKHNGGSSLKDIVTKIDNKQTSLDQKLVYVIDSLENSGTFETDPLGNIIGVSVGYCHVLGIAEEEALGNSWLNSIGDIDERDKVWKEWQESIKNKRYFSLTYKVTKDKTPISIFCRAYPLLKANKEVVGWFGLVKKVSSLCDKGPCECAAK